MKQIRTEEAIGHVLCHDITRIIPGKEKGPVFKKGHIITAEDIPVLLSVGKENLYVWEKKEGILHENDAAMILKNIAVRDSEYVSSSDPSEGKVEIRSGISGLLKVDQQRLYKVNSAGEMMMATRRGNFPVRPGDIVAATRIIPLVIDEEKLRHVDEQMGGQPVIEILPFMQMRYGIVTTGSEIQKGLIEDAFGPVLRRKMAEYDAGFLEQIIVGDGREEIADAIMKLVSGGADIVLVSGGMSVDPDDRTPAAIRDTGADVITYGAPVLPGAMFLLAEWFAGNRRVCIMGLPGCVMYAKRTVFDLVLPRVLAGERLSREEIAGYGEGGLCLGCDQCHFPDCSFGR